MASADSKILGPDAMPLWGLVKMHQAEVLQGWAHVKSPTYIMSPPFPGVFYREQGTFAKTRTEAEAFYPLIPKEANS